MTSRRDLGVSYFLGLGFGLIVTLLGYFVLAGGQANVVSITTLTALGFAGSLPYMGYWLKGSGLSDAEVWTVAQWCTVGIAIPTLIAGGFLISGVRPRLVVRFPHLMVNLIAGGGVLGALLGVIRELRRQYARVDKLNHRNRVLNQVLRQTINDEIHTISGYTELIDEEGDGDDRELLEPVQRKSRALIETSRIARHIQRLEDGSDETPSDVVRLVTECVDIMRDAHPDAEITTDLPDEAWVDTGRLLCIVIEQLVENSIEHNDRSPCITIDVEPIDTESVDIRVVDNGPGIPETHRQALTTDRTPSDIENSGLGLWFVGWFVDRHDGTLALEQNDPRGTIVRITLPAVSPPEATVRS